MRQSQAGTNRYLIQQRIKTVAQLYKETRYSGFTFAPFNIEIPGCPEDLLATKEVQAKDYKEAANSFRHELIPIIDALSVTSQCSFTILAMSFLVFRCTDPKEYAYIYLARPRETTGITLNDEIFADLDKLSEIQNKAALFYFRQSNNATTAEARLGMLIITAEALAGTTQSSRECPKCNAELLSYSITDRDKLKEIFGEELYIKLYEKGGGALRHKMFHGNKLDGVDITENIGQIYDRLLAYIQGEYGLQSVRQIVKAPRSFNASFEHVGLFVRNAHSNKYDLRKIEPKAWALFESGCSAEIEEVSPEDLGY